jgi:hypothetical protein
MFSGLISALVVAGSLLTTIAALPSTTNYELNSYGFGSGGTANSTTGNYALEGITGEASGQTASTSTYLLKPGFIETQQANVPKVTLTNPSNYYDKLHFVIDQQSNPTDALYALQISTTSNFSSGVNYIKNDDTIGPTLTLADYQTYTVWGAGGGANIIGLSPSTTYYVRAKATQGKFTESAYGPASSAATSGLSISFCLFAGATCGSGNTTNFSGLLAGTVSTSSPNLGLTFATNADNGGSVYIYSKNGALQSTSIPSGTISSVSGWPSSTDLSSAAQGYGAQVSSATSLTAQAAYGGTGNQVGDLTTTIHTLLTAGSPVTSGSATIQLQARPTSTTPAAADYADIITVIAAASF